MSKTYCLCLGFPEADPLTTFQAQVWRSQEVLPPVGDSEVREGRHGWQWRCDGNHWGWPASHLMGKLGNSMKHTFPGHPAEEATGGGFVPKHPSAIGWQLLPGRMNSWLFGVHQFFFKSFNFFGHKACRILLPQPEIEPTPPALEAWSLNPWITKEVPFGVSVIQTLSHVWLFTTPWTTACQASLSSTNSWSLLKFMSIESVMLSNPLIFSCSFSLWLQAFPGSRSFPMSQFFASSGQSIEAPLWVF